MIIRVLMGLPGAGKTTWANQQSAYIIDCDNMRGGCTVAKIANAVRKMPRYTSTTEIIVDGLFTTQKQIEEIIEAIRKKCPKDKIVIDFWQKDIEGCLRNDAKRPLERQAATTINQLANNYKKPILKDIEINEHPVLKYEYISWWDKYGLKNPYSEAQKKSKLYSESWILGGTGRNYTGESWSIETEPQPTNFIQFDELIEKLMPNISFMKYKKIYRECVSIEQYTDNNYYYTHQCARYVCDLSKLEEMLFSK